MDASNYYLKRIGGGAVDTVDKNRSAAPIPDGADVRALGRGACEASGKGLKGLFPGQG